MDTPQTPTPRPAPRRGRQALAAAALGGALLGGLWLWSGSEGSLASSLRLASALLPGGMALHSEGVQGSLRHGGRIERLDWRQDGLSLQLQALTLELDAGRLLHGTLPLHQLRLGELRGASQASTPSAPLQSVLWPLRVDLHWQIDQLHWQAAAPLSASALQGHYRFDGQQHQLTLDQLQWAQGRYQGTLQLQGRAPMALQARVQGQLPPPPRTPLALQAEAQLQGELAGTLLLRAALQPQQGTGPQLRLQASLEPSAPTPLSAVQAELQAIDLAALWPGAPQTLLHGHISAQPTSDHGDATWQAEVALDNRLTGSWDQGRVPLQTLQARVQHGAQGWQVPTLQARWPGGQLQGQMRLAEQATAWQGQWQVERLQPGQWFSAASGPALSGRVQAEQLAPGGVLNLQARLVPEGLASAPDDKAPGLQLQARREGALWTVKQLQLDWAEAHVQAQGRWHSDRRSLDGQAQAQLPGLQAQLGGQLSAQQGQGQWQLDGPDSQRLLAWLQRWPALRAALPDLQVQGRWRAQGQWQGGWASPALQLQASAQSDRLVLQGPGQHSQLEQVQLQLRGPVQALQAEVRANWQGAAGRAELQVQAQAGRSNSAAATDWLGQLTQLRASWQATGQSQALQLRLAAAQSWQWRGAEQRLQWQAQAWHIQRQGTQGPDGQATLQWQAGEWQAARHPGATPRARVQATLSALPLRWAQTLGLAAEVQGDLLLQGGLQWQQDEQLQAQAWLERSQGDLQLRADAAQGARLQAGLRTASARLKVDGADAALDLRWDSEQAGQLEAHLGSRLASSGPLDTRWHADAPLAGRVQARLPRMQAWSWLAPPGWRVQGTVDARFDVAGTRSQPRWQGTLQADDLALRSAVEGVEFRQGRLRARLQERALLIDELQLSGAGAQGGELSAQGALRWQAPDGQDGPSLQTLQMDVQAQARALRVSNRADRRLTVSGQARAQWQAGRMRLSGELQADSALFILPDDSTPQLGADVVITNKTHTPGKPLSPKASPSLMGVPEVQVLLRLGPDFQLRGHGITTRLAGELQLSSGAASQGLPRLAGQVRTEGGRYKAYGQALEVEQGLLRFAGPYDNPALDILALRPNLSQRVGVRVTGTALAPQVRLYAEPEMPDADTLAWLVLGRSAAAGGAESAVLQQAALALLGGSGRRLGGELASALGLDDVSLANRSASTDGSTVSGTAVTLGKRLSKDFYLAYESSVSGSFGSLFIFYELSRQLSLRAQAGEVNALDLIYTIRHD